jgi:hypothetical protein
MDKKLSSINAVSQEQDASSMEPDVAAFWPQQKQQPPNNQQSSNNQGNCTRGQGFFRGNSNNRMSSQTQGLNASIMYRRQYFDEKLKHKN